MKQFLLYLLLLTCGILSGKEVFRCDFTPGELKKWTLPSQAAQMRESHLNFVRLTMPEAVNSGTYLTIPFDVSRYRGNFLQVSCRLRAIEVSKPGAYFNGVKFMLHLNEDSRPTWKQITRVWGTFDWRPISFGFPVSNSMSGGEIQLGLQESSGSVDFADLRVEVLEMTEVYPPVAKLPVGFRAEYTSRVTSIPRLRGAMSPTSYRKGDLDVLASWGANLVRWQMNSWGHVKSNQDLAEFDRWLDKELDNVELVLADCERLGMKVALDLHSPPGDRLEDHDIAMCHNPEYAQAFIDAWKKIATRFKGRTSAFYGYNLVNEPTQMRKSTINYLELQYKAALAIREIDPDVPIIIESNNSASPETFSYLTPLPLKNVIYQTHMYLPGTYSHQGIVGQSSGEPSVYPGIINGVEYNRKALCKLLEPVRRFQLKYGARIYVGEFAAVRWAEGADRYFADLISIFEEYGWDWSYHAFRESKTWDVEYQGGSHGKGEVKATVPTARLKVLQEGFRRNRSGQE